jgi:hypothetical protein
MVSSPPTLLVRSRLEHLLRPLDPLKPLQFLPLLQPLHLVAPPRSRSRRRRLRRRQCQLRQGCGDGAPSTVKATSARAQPCPAARAADRRLRRAARRNRPCGGAARRCDDAAGE